jgi:hypothetical protein
MDQKKTAPIDPAATSKQAASVPAAATEATEATEQLAKPEPDLAEAMRQLELELASQQKSATGANKLQ